MDIAALIATAPKEANLQVNSQTQPANVAHSRFIEQLFSQVSPEKIQALKDENTAEIAWMKEQMQQLFEANAVDMSIPVTLMQENDGTIIVTRPHPQKSAIEGLLNEHYNLGETMKRIQERSLIIASDQAVRTQGIIPDPERYATEFTLTAKPVISDLLMRSLYLELTVTPILDYYDRKAANTKEADTASQSSASLLETYFQTASTEEDENPFLG